MKTLTATYNETKDAWETGIQTLEGNAFFEIELKKKGYVIIAQEMGGKYPTALRSDYNKHFEIKCCLHELSDVENKKIVIYTSEEPNFIRYANI